MYKTLLVGFGHYTILYVKEFARNEKQSISYTYYNIMRNRRENILYVVGIFEIEIYVFYFI
jgi:hypothetical protein